MKREIVYTLTIEQDTDNPGWQKSMAHYIEDTGKTPFDFEQEMREMFKNSLQQHLQSELGPEGITVTVDNYEG